MDAAPSIEETQIDWSTQILADIANDKDMMAMQKMKKNRNKTNISVMSTSKSLGYLNLG